MRENVKKREMHKTYRARIWVFLLRTFLCLGCPLVAVGTAFATMLAEAFGTVITAVVLAVVVLGGVLLFVVLSSDVQREHDEDKLQVGDLVKVRDKIGNMIGNVVAVHGGNVQVHFQGEAKGPVGAAKGASGEGGEVSKNGGGAGQQLQLQDYAQDYDDGVSVIRGGRDVDEVEQSTAGGERPQGVIDEQSEGEESDFETGKPWRWSEKSLRSLLDESLLDEAAPSPIIEGSVASIEIVDSGDGYGSADPTVTLLCPQHGTGIPATATATVKDGKIAKITITRAGSGYNYSDSSHEVTITPASGVTPSKRATAKAHLDRSVELCIREDLVRIPLKAKREVRVRVNVLKVVGINLAAQTFTVDVQFEASWVDCELKENIMKRVRRTYNDFRKLHREKELDKDVSKWTWDEKTAKLLYAFYEKEVEVMTWGDKTNQELGKLQIKYGGNKKSSGKKFFAPRLKLLNLIGKVNEEKWFDFYPTKDAGGAPGQVVVCYKWKLEQATFQEFMELAEFPFDEQRLQMILSSGWAIENKENSVQLVHNNNSNYRSFVTMNNFLQCSEYKLFSAVTFECKYSKRKDSASKEMYSLLHCTMNVERKTGYWYIHVMLPLFIVTSCVLPTYAVPPDEFGDRASILFTLLLAQVAYKYVIAEKLPNISYMTLLDTYVFICFAATFVVVILHFCENRNIIPQRVLQCSNFTMIGCKVVNTSLVNDNTQTTSSYDTGWTGIDLSPPVREVQISVYFLWLSIIWLGGHLILLCLFVVVRINRIQKHRSWDRTTSLWLSPVNFADQTKGSVVSITITAAGAGYGSTAPKVTLSSPEDGTEATAEAILTNGSVSSLRITNAGSGYTSAPEVTITHADGETPPGLKPATAVAILTDSVASIEITDAGTGYKEPPKIVVDPPNDGTVTCTTATATATVKDGKITDITIKNAGSGYNAPPGVQIEKPPDGGVQATADAILSPTKKECESALNLFCDTISGSLWLDDRLEKFVSGHRHTFRLWIPKEANTELTKSRSRASCHYPCAVVRFHGHNAEDLADLAVDKNANLKLELCNPLKNSEWKKYYPLKNTKVQYLDQDYQALDLSSPWEFI